MHPNNPFDHANNSASAPGTKGQTGMENAANISDISAYPGEYFTDKGPEIRLLTILPGRQGEPVSCSLRVHQFQGIQNYEALSYRWGSYVDKETISINGISFTVTRNLFDALQHLRRAASPRIMWIDAICIKQSDIRERNHQVRQMGEIYRRAHRVLVWLGLDSTSSRDAFDFLRRSYLRSPFNRKELVDDDGWMALNDLAQNQYWGRVWIIQEICLAEHITIVCGQETIPWAYITELRLARKHIWTRYLSQGERLFMRSFIARIDQQREIVRKGGSSRLWNLLENFRESECQDIHDKVYGLIGMATDCDGGIVIDYSKDVTTLYRDVIWLYYKLFRGVSSSPPYGSQLMALSMSLQGILESHLRKRGILEKPFEGLPHVRVHPGGLPSPTQLSISAPSVFVIHQFLSHENAEKYKAVQLVQFLKGQVPHSHLGPWRDWVDPELEDVRELPSHCALAISHVSTPQISGGETIQEPAVFVGIGLAQSGLETAQIDRFVIGIAPRGTRVGDLVCTFVESSISLVVRPANDSVATGLNLPEAQHALVGSASVDWTRSSLEQRFKSHLGVEKDIVTTQLVAGLGTDKFNSPWQMTVTMDISTAEYLTQPNPEPLPKGFDNITFELFPLKDSSSPDQANKAAIEKMVQELFPSQPDGSSDVQPWNRRLQDEDVERFRLDPELRKHALGPAYTGIINLGSTGYLSCTLQILYMLKPFRKVILGLDQVPQGQIIYEVREIFRSLQSASLPVSPLPLAKFLRWKEGALDINEALDLMEFFRVFTDMGRIPYCRSVAQSFEDIFLGTLRTSLSTFCPTLNVPQNPFVIDRGRWNETRRDEQFYDLSIRGIEGSLNKAFEQLTGSDYGRSTSIARLPKALLVEPKFFQYDSQQNKIIIWQGRFEYPSRFRFSESMLAHKEDQDVEYQLHCVGLREEVKPLARFLLYLRPRQENQWLLFFNEQITWARESEVFQKNFDVGETPELSGKRVPSLLLYLQVSKLDELLS